MEGFNLSEITESLQDNVIEHGISFEGRALNLATLAEAEELIEAIRKCPALHYLNLEGNTLGVQAAEGIGKALEEHPELRKALWKDLFTGRLKTEIPLALRSLSEGMIKGNVKLAVLDCSDNALGPNGLIGLLDLLNSPTCYSLQELKLNNCGLGATGGKMLAETLLNCYQFSVQAGEPFQLKVFIAGRNRLENDGAIALSNVFATVGSLETIEMPQNGIYQPGMVAISDALQFNPNMKILNLNDNTIRQRSAMAIADALQSMPYIEHINLGDCLLKTRGACILADALYEEHTNLQILELGFNEIGPDGGMQIAYAMHNKNLTKLDLDGNHFGEQCRNKIIETLTELDKIDAVTMEGDDSEVEGSDADDDDDDNNDGDEENDEIPEDEEEYVGYNEVYIDSAIDAEKDGTSINTTNNHDNSSVWYIDEINLPNTIYTFCTVPHPTETLFDKLEENDIEGFRRYLKTLPENDYLTQLVFVILKCSAISKHSQNIMDLCQALYQDCFDYAKETNQLARVKNFFLIQLNLLKSEDKTFTPDYDVQACRAALAYAIKQNTFTDDIKNVFEFFLETFP